MKIQNRTSSQLLNRFYTVTLAGLMAAMSLAQMETSKQFEGVKANTGTVSYSKEGNQNFLTLSDDFVVPDSPAPTWQIVDVVGNTYTLDSLKLKGDRIAKKIAVPSYIHSIAKVQIWCAWAEVLLGQTTFNSPILLDKDMMMMMKGHTSKKFEGVKANTGTVSHSKIGGQNILTLSEDFKVPDAPAPTWRVVDSKGNIYTLQRLLIKGDKVNRQIMVPSYVPDIAKVQIYCVWAEALLGETSFDHPVK